MKEIYKTVSRNVFSQHILLDDEMWNYTLSCFDKDYDCINEYEKIKMLFKKEFNNNKLLFDIETKNYIDYIRKILNNIKLDEAFIAEYDDNVEKFIKKEKLIEGHIYFSIDLTKAADQLINYHTDIKGELDVIRDHASDKKLIKESKKIRLLSYGNATQQIKQNGFLKYLNLILYKIYNDDTNIIIQTLKKLNAPLAATNLDELIFDITDINENLCEYLGDFKILKYDIHTSIFKYHCIYYRDYNDIPHRFEIRENINGTNNFIMKRVPYFLQIYKKYYGMEITNKDLRIRSCDVSKPYFQLKEPIKFITKDEYLDYWNNKKS